MNTNRKAYISNNTIRRFPKYLRVLQDLGAIGHERITSSELAKLLDFTASTVRQDFSCIGEAGQTGYGYNIHLLEDKIEELLGLNTKLSAVMIGAGNLGRTLLLNIPFLELGIDNLQIFDISTELIGSEVMAIP